MRKLSTAQRHLARLLREGRSFTRWDVWEAIGLRRPTYFLSWPAPVHRLTTFGLATYSTDGGTVRVVATEKLLATKPPRPSGRLMVIHDEWGLSDPLED